MSELQIEALKTKIGDVSAPADAQAEVNDQAAAWKKVWSGGPLDQGDPVWPEDLGTIPPMILVQALLDAANTFPRDTGLGWDRVHPRAIRRSNWSSSAFCRSLKGGSDQ